MYWTDGSIQFFSYLFKFMLRRIQNPYCLTDSYLKIHTLGLLFQMKLVLVKIVIIFELYIKYHRIVLPLFFQF